MAYHLQLFLPLGATAAVFSMQPGILPAKAYSGKIFLACWLSLTSLVVLAITWLRWWPSRLYNVKKRDPPSQSRGVQSQQGRLAGVGSVASLIPGLSRQGDDYGTDPYADGIELGLVQSTRSFVD